MCEIAEPDIVMAHAKAAKIDENDLENAVGGSGLPPEAPRKGAVTYSDIACQKGYMHFGILDEARMKPYTDGNIIVTRVCGTCRHFKKTDEGEWTLSTQGSCVK